MVAVAELRKFRAKALKNARIVFNDGSSTINCVIGNLSATGALLRAKSVVGVPPTFILIGPDGIGRLCRIVWRSENELGVTFQSPLPR
jgi:hypothetical protein